MEGRTLAAKNKSQEKLDVDDNNSNQQKIKKSNTDANMNKNKKSKTNSNDHPKRPRSGKSNFKQLNLLLVILIVVSSVILVYRLSLKPEEHEFEPKLPNEGIINIHEHIHRFSDAEKWLEAMEQCGVSATVMLGSPEATFKLSAPPGFNNFTENNDLILWLEEKYDSKILAFPTIDPRDPGKLTMLKENLKEGAFGLKLYSGHTGEIFPAPNTTLYDYLGPLNRSDMFEVYEYCEKNRVPIIWHIKLYWDYLYEELTDVLDRFPNLIVNIPHFGVLGPQLGRLDQLMENYSGIYTDISFGGFAKWSMVRVSDNVEVFQEFVQKNHDRVMFGTDMVVTDNVRKTVPWIVNLTMGYRDMLEKDEFHINVQNITGEGDGPEYALEGTLNGLGLSQEVLDEIYFETPLRFLKGEPTNEVVTNQSRNLLFTRGLSDNLNYITLKFKPLDINIEVWNTLILIAEERQQCCRTLILY